MPLTEKQLFNMRKNEEFPLVDAILNHNIKRAKRKLNEEKDESLPDITMP